MLVRVKKGLGNYGHVQNGSVQPKNYASGAFEVSEAKGRELLARGIVEAVGGETAPAADAQTETPEPKKPENAAKKAPKKTEKTTKKVTEKTETPADDVPTFDTLGGVE